MSSGERVASPGAYVDKQEVHAGGVGVLQRSEPYGGNRRSTVPSTANEPLFLGRDRELRAIHDQLQVQPAIVLYGHAGLGKSRLAKEYAHQHSQSYPGGTFFVSCEKSPPDDLARLLRHMGLPTYADEPFEDMCRRALAAVGSAGRALLIYDAIADERVLDEWLPPAGLEWHLIVTSTSASWNSVPSLRVMPLHPDAQQALGRSILGHVADPDSVARMVARIATSAAGITVQLCPHARAVRERLRHGRPVADVEAELAKDTVESFASAWRLLSQPAQIVLSAGSTFATPNVPVSLIAAAFSRIGWSLQAVEDAIDEVRDRQLAAGDVDRLEIHQLVARFVRTREPLAEPVRRSLLVGLLGAAREFFSQPADLDRRALLAAHSFEVTKWEPLIVDGSDWHAVGNAVAELGRFAEALPWFERAVAAAEKGDVHGRVDAESLGTSLHEVGMCYSRQGKFVEALPWFKRAVAAAKKGDAHGRVDTESLGTSLHQVGYCYSRQGKFAEALRWFERAVDAKEKGDVHGRVDAAKVGRSLHQVGMCYSRQGKFAEALQWFKRAVAAAEKGDVHGRVDTESLGTSLHQVGYCYSQQGKFAEALPWLKRAIAATEKGDVHGRVDAANVGKSLHQVGYCYGSQGKFAEALRWFVRAVAAAEKGDIHGRVDADRLGTSLHLVGDCYHNQGKFSEALPWFERAVVAKEKGDVHGRVDAESLGKSLHQVGDCYHRQGKLAEAAPCFERAVAAKEKGDVHGRVDAESLGTSLYLVGDCYHRQGKLAEAAPWFERAVAAKQKGVVGGDFNARQK